MAHEAGDGESISEAKPTIDDTHGLDYLELIHIKKGVRIRLEKEHNWAAATVSGSKAGGEHINGSAVAYEGTSTPTNRPDGLTALANNAYDRGKLWFDDNYNPPVLKRFDGSNWEVLGRYMADEASLKIYLHNEVEENADGGRETQLIFKGEKADTTIHELATIEVSQDGANDDKAGKIIFYVNGNADADGSLTQALKIGYDLAATFAGTITAAGVITNSEIPVFTKGVVANASYLSGRNSAGDGNVGMIQVGRNEADDADVVQIPDAARLASNAAPTEETQLANKKYVDDQNAWGAPTSVATKSGNTDIVDADDATSAATQLTVNTTIMAWGKTNSGSSCNISVNLWTSPNGSAWTQVGMYYLGEAANDLFAGSCKIDVPAGYYWKATVATVRGTTINTDRHYYKVEK